MDDRAGVVALVEYLRRLKDYNHEAEVLVVITVQEELGVRGLSSVPMALIPILG